MTRAHTDNVARSSGCAVTTATVLATATIVLLVVGEWEAGIFLGIATAVLIAGMMEV